MSLNPPVDIALIGTGNRSQHVYRPLFEALKPWVRLVAVCDPVREHADAFADSLDVASFYSVPDLVKARPMEAALVVAPIETHHPISCYLSQHGIHNLVETSMTNMLALGREMVSTAHENGVVMRIAENFFRFPIDRIAKKVDQTGFLGEIRRLTCFHDHTGFHNNSRWIVFFGGHPLSVQAIDHTMPTVPYYEAPHRFHTDEHFRARFFTFPGDRLVVDLAGNIKGMLGRYPRPGYTEFDGQRGTLVQWAVQYWQGGAEVRYCSDEALLHGARADQVFPVVHTSEDGCWASTYVDLPIGRVEYVNPLRCKDATGINARNYYGSAAMAHVVDFANAVREGKPSEYSGEDALMSLMMEVGARESALRNGTRLDLPLTGDLEVEHLQREAVKAKFGVDPLDWEAMLAFSFPRP